MSVRDALAELRVLLEHAKTLKDQCDSGTHWQSCELEGRLERGERALSVLDAYVRLVPFDLEYANAKIEVLSHDLVETWRRLNAVLKALQLADKDFTLDVVLAALEKYAAQLKVSTGASDA